MGHKHAGPVMEELLRRIDRNALPDLALPTTFRQSDSPDFLNAYGVCLLRLGKIHEALAVFNEITLHPHTLRVRRDVPDRFKVNLATARLLARNPRGCLEALRMMDNRKTANSQRLRTAVRRWSASLPLLQRLIWRIGVPPTTPIRLDFVPGDFDDDAELTIEDT